jgi:hypothetical protein
MREGGYTGGPTPEGTPPIPPAFRTTLLDANDLSPALKEAGDAVIKRIKDLAAQCPPMYIEQLAAAYAQLVSIAKGR